MKDHIPTFAMLAALVVLLLVVIALVAMGVKTSDPMLLLIAGAAQAVAGGICGFSQSRGPQNNTLSPQTIDQATTSSSPPGQKD